MDSIPLDSMQDNTPPKMTFIYILIDPRTSEVRYVGKANNPKARLSKHLRQTDDTYKQRWIRELQSQGLKPLMKPIEEIPQKAWQARERYWIDWYRSQGAPLTNTAPGGQAGGMSPEGRARLIAFNTGRKRGPEFQAKMQAIADTKKGIKRPPEVGAKVSAARTGKKRKPFSEEWKQKLGNSRRGKSLSPRQKAQLHSPEANAKRVATKKAQRTMKKYPPHSPTLWD